MKTINYNIPVFENGDKVDLVSYSEKMEQALSKQIEEQLNLIQKNHGKSAYEIAVNNGFTGTEEQWLTSLKGRDGTNGAKGDKGDNGVQGLKGDKGDTGLQGPKGEKGDIGEQGLKGDKGDTGENGYTPVKGIDYFTENDISEMVDAVIVSINDNFNKKYEHLKRIIAELHNLNTLDVDTSEVDNYVLSLNENDYTNWEAFMNVVNDVKSEVLQSTFNSRINEVKAYNLQAKPFEKNELENLKRTLENLDEINYSKQSWTSLQVIIETAENVTLKSQYDAVKEELTIDNLVAIPVIHFSDGYSENMTFVKANVNFDYDNAVYVTHAAGETINATYTTNLKPDDIGEYQVIYSAVDSVGNQADEVIITIKITDLAPIICYYNEDNISAVIPSGNGTFFTRYITVFADKGTMTISKNGVEIGTFTGEKELIEDGIYTIKAVADGCPSSEKTFVIDTSKPTVSGVKTKIYQRAVTFSFSDENGIGKATLTKIDFNPETDTESEREIDLTGLNSYTVDKNGEYELRIEDIYGNAIDPITFTIKIPTV